MHRIDVDERPDLMGVTPGEEIPDSMAIGFVSIFVPIGRGEERDEALPPHRNIFEVQQSVR